MSSLPFSRHETILAVVSMGHHCHVACRQHPLQYALSSEPPWVMRPSLYDGEPGQGEHGQIAREPLLSPKVEWRMLARIQSCIILILTCTWQGKAAMEGSTRVFGWPSQRRLTSTRKTPTKAGAGQWWSLHSRG
jgi:hypothetical protein